MRKRAAVLNFHLKICRLGRIVFCSYFLFFYSVLSTMWDARMVLVTHHHYHQLRRNIEKVCHSSISIICSGGGSSSSGSRKYAKKVSSFSWIFFLLFPLIYQTSGQGFGLHYPLQNGKPHS